MKKKLLFSEILILFFLFALTTASAQTLTISPVSGKQGDTVAIPITFTNDSNNVLFMQFDIVADTSLASVTGITKGTVIKNFDFGYNETEPGRFTILIFPPQLPFSPIPGGEIARLTVKILKTVNSVDINFENVEMIDSTGTEDIIPKELNNGKITNPLVPKADAGEDQTILEGNRVMLDASASFNPDGGGLLSYKWEQISGITVMLSGSNIPQPDFTAPEVDDSGDILIFKLTLKNSVGFEDTDEVTINVEDATPIISLNPSLKYISETEGEFSVEVANTGTGVMNWTAASDSDWLKIIQGSETDIGTIKVNYTANTGEIRIARIIVTAPDAINNPQICEVIQDPSDWIKMDTGISSHLRGIWGSSENNVFAVGRDGVILHYDGKTWEAMTSNNSDYLRSVWGSSENDVFAVGYSGTILHYDGNEAGLWEEMNSGVSGDLNSVWGISEKDVFAVGEDGIILHYDGISWSKMTVPTFNPLYSIWGDSGNDIYAVGGVWNDFIILHYDGNNWTEITDSFSNIPYSIWGNAGNNIFAVGNAGMISRYNGNNWTEMKGDTANYLRGIWGNSSGSNLFAVGVGGIILRYNGNEWREMSVGASDDLFAVWGSSETNIFAVGNSGVILRHGLTDPLSVTPSEIEVSAAGGTTDFEVIISGSGISWKAESNADWLKIESGSSGIDNGTIKVSYIANPGDERTGKITVTTTGTVSDSQSIEIKQNKVIRGDVDGNGIIDLRDAILVLKVLTGNAANDNISVFADVNGDGKIGIEDLLYILRAVVY